MKATTWLGPILTLLYATRQACTAQRGGGGGDSSDSSSSAIMDYGYGYVYPLDYLDTNLLQDDYMVAKRNKPSLSIVNPLDVLRQRLLLEIARRQMKENTRQVELNRAILKNVGKRSSAISYNLSRRYRTAVAEQQHAPPEHQQRLYREQLLLQQKQPHHYRYYYYPTSQQEQQQQQQQQQFDRMTPTSIFDFLQQRPQNVFGLEAALQNADEKKKSLSAGRDGGGDNVGLSMSSVANKQHQVNGNEIGNETNHGNNNNNNNLDNMDKGTSVAIMNSGSNSNNVDGGGGDGSSGIIFVDNEHNGDDLTDDVGGGNIGGHVSDNNHNDDDDDNDGVDIDGNNDNININNARYRQMNYLYRLHKNRFARK